MRGKTMPNNMTIKMPDGTRISITQGEGMMGDRSDGTVEIGILNDKGILMGDPRGYVDGSQLHQILEGML
jgi:hypothetical protein|tara:strand:+ start:356 stop:565 length:210 start_codon:yes stop_codon:yes gene_type:complete